MKNTSRQLTKTFENLPADRAPLDRQLSPGKPATDDHDFYNFENFPILVAEHGNWDIYRSNNGYCAAIAVVPGCKSSHFGDYNYARGVLLMEGIELPRLTKDGAL